MSYTGNTDTTLAPVLSFLNTAANHLHYQRRDRGGRRRGFGARRRGREKSGQRPQEQGASRNPCVKLIKDHDKPCVKLIKDNDNPCAKLTKDDDNPCVKLIKDNDKMCVKLFNSHGNFQVNSLKCDPPLNL